MDNNNRLINPQIINDIRHNAKIVDIIGRYIKLQKKGNSYFGLCPFHQDNHPSLSVSPSKNIWTCFVCGAKGTVFDFIKKYEKCSFIDAVKKVAELSNYDISSIDAFKYKKGDSLSTKQKRIILANNRINKFYSNELLLKSENQPVLDYLFNRGLNQKTIKKFEIGFAPNSKFKMIDYLTNKDNMLGELNQDLVFNEQELLNAGIAVVNKDDQIQSLLINRITFPIYDANNRLVAFSGRDVSNHSESKYLHTMSTAAFDKSKVLYNFNRQDFTKDDTLIICEGFMDCIAYDRAGYTNCVAAMGTQITENHLYLLKMHKTIKSITLSFDNDNAGTIANIRNAKFLIDNGYIVSIANYQSFNQKDIDEIIKVNGLDAAKKVINDREEFVCFLIRKRLSIKQPIDEIRITVNELIDDIIDYGDSFLTSKYFKLITSLTDYDLDAIKEEYNARVKKRLSLAGNCNYSSYNYKSSRFNNFDHLSLQLQKQAAQVQKELLDTNKDYEKSTKTTSWLISDQKKKNSEIKQNTKKIIQALSEIIIQALFVPQSYVPYVNQIAFNNNKQYNYLLFILKFIDNEIGKNNSISSDELMKKLKKYLEKQATEDETYKKSLTWFADKCLKLILTNSMEAKKKKNGNYEQLMKDNVFQFKVCKYDLLIIQAHLSIIENCISPTENSKEEIIKLNQKINLLCESRNKLKKGK